jgi:hypothetical protein
MPAVAGVYPLDRVDRWKEASDRSGAEQRKRQVPK